MRVALLGPPGSGKGTQADRIGRAYDVPHLSTGGMLRVAVAERTKEGMSAKDVMARGDLVSDDVVVAIVADRIARSNCTRGFVLDGFPRNVAQAKALDGVLNRGGAALDVVLELRASHDVLIDRIVRRRGVDGEIRMDDSEEVLRHRLDVYDARAARLTAFYAQRGNLFHTVDGMADVDDVTRKIFTLIDAARGGESHRTVKGPVSG